MRPRLSRRKRAARVCAVLSLVALDPPLDDREAFEREREDLFDLVDRDEERF